MANPPRSPFFKGGRKKRASQPGEAPTLTAPFAKGGGRRRRRGIALGAENKSPLIPLFQRGKKKAGLLIRRGTKHSQPPLQKGAGAQGDGGFALPFSKGEEKSGPLDQQRHRTLTAPFAKRGPAPKATGDLLSAPKANPPCSPFFKGGRKSGPLDQQRHRTLTAPFAKGGGRRRRRGICSWRRKQIPLYPPFSKGEEKSRPLNQEKHRTLSAPFAKGGGRRRRRGICFSPPARRHRIARAAPGVG